MGNLHFIGGEKGGVGKSFTARLLAQYYIDKKRAFVGFDTDQSHQTFSRFYGEFTSTINVNEEGSLDNIIDSAESHPESDILVDLAAQTLGPLSDWLEETELFSLMQDMGFKSYFWHVMDDGADSLQVLRQQFQRFENADIQFVIVLNEGRGDDFSGFESSDAHRWALDHGAKIMEITRLQTQRARVWLKWQYHRLDSVLSNVVVPQERKIELVSAESR